MHIQRGEQNISPIATSCIIYYGCKVLLAHFTRQKFYMAPLRNIDHVGTYTSPSFIIDNFVQGELSTYVECKAQCGVFIPSQCAWLRCFSVLGTTKAQGANIGCDQDDMVLENALYHCCIYWLQNMIYAHLVIYNR